MYTQCLSFASWWEVGFPTLFNLYKASLQSSLSGKIIRINYIRCKNTQLCHGTLDTKKFFYDSEKIKRHFQMWLSTFHTVSRKENTNTLWRNYCFYNQDFFRVHTLCLNLCFSFCTHFTLWFAARRSKWFKMKPESETGKEIVRVLNDTSGLEQHYRRSGVPPGSFRKYLENL